MSTVKVLGLDYDYYTKYSISTSWEERNNDSLHKAILP